MPSVTLLAQPLVKKPYVGKSALKAGKYEPHPKGTFGLIWLTDVGKAVWEACLQTDAGARLRLLRHGFDELDWSMAFKVGDIKARLECIKYKGHWGKVANCYCRVRVKCDERDRLGDFITKVYDNLPAPPFDFKDRKSLEAETDLPFKEIKAKWEKVLGFEIKRPDRPIKAKEAAKDKPTKAKTSRFSLGSITQNLPIPGMDGSKTPEADLSSAAAPDGATAEGEADTEDDIIAMEDGQGNEVRFRIHGTLEVEESEYAVFTPADQEAAPYDITVLLMLKDDDGQLSYESLEDAELEQMLIEAARENLEGLGEQDSDESGKADAAEEVAGEAKVTEKADAAAPAKTEPTPQTTPAESKELTPEDYDFISSEKAKRYHLETCPFAINIPEDKRIIYAGYSQARKSGKKGCNCTERVLTHDEAVEEKAAKTTGSKKPAKTKAARASPA